MTIEELEILVDANIEPAIKKLKKLIPQIQSNVNQAVNSAKNSMEKLDMNKINNKIGYVINSVNKKIKQLKDSKKVNLDIAINNEKVKSQVNQIEKEIESLQKKISGRELKLQITNDTLEKMKSDAYSEVKKSMPDIDTRNS